MNQPKRNLKIWIPIAAVLCFWLGDWMGHTYELTEGTTTHRLTAALNLNSLLLHPFRLSADAFSLGCGIAAALMAGLIYLCVKYSKHRLMPQKEYGSARWGGPEDIAPFLNENPQNNLPLTASESLSLSPKMKVTANDNYNRNKNVIVFGPSGSGKSYSVAGPQLLQFNSNYVLSDPKGELLQEYGNVLLSQGYKVKVFNLKDRDKSDHYNLFAYIKNEDDILVVTKNLVKNLKEDPTAKSTADPIWEEGMTALLEALIGYVFYELEPEERNMNNVMTLLLMLESQGDGPNSVSQLDLSCQGKFVYAQPSSLRGGPGNPSVGINLDCSSFVQYCYWAQNLPFSAGSTAAYRNAADLVSISPSEVQPGDLRVVYASGGEQGHVQMALGSGVWIECCYGYGVAVNMSNAWMESRPCYYFRYAGF